MGPADIHKMARNIVCREKFIRNTNEIRKIMVRSLQFSSSLPVAPDSLRLIGPSEARAGELLSYSCSTTNSNPAAAIHWTVGNETRPAERTNVVRSPSGGYITHSEITVSLGATDHSKMIVCNAVNTELNDAKSESKMLSVICKC